LQRRRRSCDRRAPDDCLSQHLPTRHHPDERVGNGVVRLLGVEPAASIILSIAPEELKCWCIPPRGRAASESEEVLRARVFDFSDIRGRDHAAAR